MTNDEFEVCYENFEAGGHRLVEIAMNAVFCLNPTELQ